MTSIAAWLLTVCGIGLVGIGGFFVVAHPPLLPEDARFMGSATFRLVFSWNISPRWQIEIDTEKRSEVEVTFTALAEDRTRVDINHRHLDRHGDGWAGVKEGVSTDEGWPLYLIRYADLVAA